MKRHLRLSLLLLAVITTAASVAIGNPQRVVQSLPPALDRLPEAKLIEVKDEAGQVILSGEFTTASDTAEELERVAVLTGGGGQNYGYEPEYRIVKLFFGKALVLC